MNLPSPFRAALLLAFPLLALPSALAAQAPRDRPPAVGSPSPGDDIPPEHPTRPGGHAPRIGLVLGGGGARGFAHLGVIKVLHELGVPVDVVVGTSMGAVVGGIWATGIPYPELERRFIEQDWSRLFRDAPERSELPVRRKRDDREMLLGVEVGLGREGFRLPSAAITGATLINALRGHLLPARDVEDFDDLPIPFRAVATSTSTGEMVVLERGDLATAVRASLAVPAVFAPQAWEGDFLVDGAVVRNLPIDVIQELGVDHVIAVDVATPLDETDGQPSALGLPARIISIVTTGNARAQLERLGPDDLVIRPEMPGLSAGDFEILEEAMTAGEEAAREAAPTLREFADPVRYAELSERRAARYRAALGTGTVRVAELRVDTEGTRLSPGIVRELLEVHPGDVLGPEDLDARLSRLLGYGGFVSAEYGLLPLEPEEAASASSPDGSSDSETDPPSAVISDPETEAGGEGRIAEEILVVRPVDKPWGPVFLRAGLELIDRQRGLGPWQMTLAAHWQRFTPSGGELRGWLDLGRRHGIRFELHQPLGDGLRWFVGMGGALSRSETLLAESDLGAALQLDLQENAIEVQTGRVLGNWGLLEIGGTLTSFALESAVGVPGETSRWREASTFVRGEIDQLDRASFPEGGVLLRGEVRGSHPMLGGKRRFTQGWGSALALRSKGSVTLRAEGEIGLSSGSEIPFPRTYTLGGLFRLTGIEVDAIRGNQLLLSSLGVMWRPSEKSRLPFPGRLRVGAGLEIGQSWERMREMTLDPGRALWGGTVWAGMDTFLGPVHAAYGWVDGYSPTWVIQLGNVR